MPGPRRTAIELEADRRLAERQTRLAGAVRTMRRRRRWTQAQLAGRAGVGTMVVGRLERSEGPICLLPLERIALALGVPLRVDFGLDPQEDTADAGHLGMQELVLRLGRAGGFDRQFELATRPAEPWRSIDVALGSHRSQVAVHVECWNTFGDIGASARSSSRKLAELEQMAVARWGADARAALVWVVRDSVRNRAIVAKYPEVFAARFPGSSRAWVAALSAGGPFPTEPGLVWCDMRRGRLYAWRRR